ncbi:Uncharacterized protein conserved in bacteria [Raoultella planticola]|uniref:Uncharacterized protein conserved in bacteria n=1 Tax=Raoultella planticola TaxID=575 RepID=A0A485D6Y0_RAOPL|nr:Uncharacterized protein conserved in bacteria [Raoultella planticola]
MASFSSSALALTLGEAREQGRVGETLNGYLAPLRQDKRNAGAGQTDQRGQERKLSAQLADDNNLPVDEVAKNGRAKTGLPGRQPGGVCSGT